MDKKTPKQAMTQERIIAAALALLNEEGLNELSLRKLASKVSLKAPALYWYFKNKEELVDYMAEAILIREFSNLAPRSDNEPWQEWLITTCKHLRTAMLRYRDGGRIVAGAHLYPAVTLARLMEVATDSLNSAGVSNSTTDLIVSTAIHFTFGRVIEEQSSPSLEEILAMDTDSLFLQYPRMARHIRRIQASGEQNGFTDENFERALRLIIR